MATPAKSSMAALLLLVAVLAGTCASGAYANFDLVNTCEKDALVSLGLPPGDVLCPAKGIVRIVGVTVGDIRITIDGKVYVLLKADLDALGVDILDILVKLEIICNGSCGKDQLTIKVYVKVSVLGGVVKVGLAGTVCARAEVSV